MKKKSLVINRVYTANIKDENSYIKYEVTASRDIIQEILDTCEKIIDKYPKDWDKEL